MRNPFRRDCPDDVMAALWSLRTLQRSRGAASTLHSMLVYASVGRDRRRLTMDFADRTRRQMEKANRLELEILEAERRSA